MNRYSMFMVFDCESIGLHGETFAVGYVVIDGKGQELAAARYACPAGEAVGDEADRAWVAENIPDSVSGNVNCANPWTVRELFWRDWLRFRESNVAMVADCCWPVEARFLAACVDDNPAARAWQGPYPLHEIATVRLAVGLDPLETEDRRPDEMPAHDPLADARQSARLLVEALNAIADRNSKGQPA